MSVRLRNAQLAVVQDAGGSAPSVSASDVLLAKNVQIHPGGKVNRRHFFRSTLSSQNPVNQISSMRVTFETELRGSGDNSTAETIIPDCDKLLRACSLSCETSDSSGWCASYTPVSSNSDSSYVMIRLIEDGIVYDIREAAGTLSVEISAGLPVRLLWEFQGRYVCPTDGDLLTGTAFPTNLPPIAENTNLILGGSYSEASYSRLQIALNNTIAVRTSANDDLGLRGVRITKREVGGTFVPEMVSTTDYHYWQKWEQSSSQSLALTVGSAAGNKIAVSLPSVVWQAPVPEERDGLRVLSIPFSASGHDDEILIRYE